MKSKRSKWFVLGILLLVLAYDKDLFFVPNAINRYAISQRDPFVTHFRASEAQSL